MVQVLLLLQTVGFAAMQLFSHGLHHKNVRVEDFGVVSYLCLTDIPMCLIYISEIYSACTTVTCHSLSLRIQQHAVDLSSST